MFHKKTSKVEITPLIKINLVILTILNWIFFRGLTGFLPADEASPKNNKDFIDSKDEFMEIKEKNEDKERKIPTKKTSKLKKKLPHSQ